MRRFVLFVFCSIIGALLISETAFTSTITWKFSLDRSEVNFLKSETGTDFINVNGFEATKYLDYPSMPYRIVTILIPQEDKVYSVKLIDIESLNFEKTVSLDNYQGEILGDGTKLGLTADKESLVTSDSVFPKWQIRYLGTNKYRGYKIASIAIYPLHYSINNNQLEMIKNAKLVVETIPDEFKSGDANRIRYVKGFREESRSIAESIVENTHMLSSYVFEDIRVDDTGRGFLPSYLPSMEGSEVKYLIITNEDMKSTFQEFADWKTKKGVPAIVKTVEWIEDNYRNGVDLAESVRNFIQEAYAKWGVEWVLLAGDVDVVPERIAYVSFYYGEFIPTDMYYSCLDGTWNADGDSLWGEAGGFVPGDEADMYSEVYIGRMPVSTIAEAELLINKTKNYEKPTDALSKEKFLMLGEVISPSDYTPGDDIWLDGAEMLQNIYEDYLEGNAEITTDRLYENYPPYPGSVELNKANALSYLNVGTNHVVDAGHGSKYNMSVGDASILNYDASNLANGEAIFSMYLMNCTNAAFDTDCLAEYFLLNSGGGAYAVTGSSRSAFPSTSRVYMDEYYRLVFDEKIMELGKLHTLSREPFTPAAIPESSHRWTHFIYNLLGDPEAMMFRGEVKFFSVTAPASVPMGENDIVIQVNSDGAPFDSAKVCLYKENDDYVYGNTDATGTITFNDFLCREAGLIYLTVTGLNNAVYLDSIDVLQDTNPYLRVSDKAYSDVSGGNGDGIIDSGEILDLNVQIENSGGSDAEKLYAVISSSDTGVTVTDSTAIYPDIDAGENSFAGDNFSFSISPGYGDEEVIEFQIAIRDSIGSQWIETFAFEVHAPRIELYINSKSDELPYGDGDGTIEQGESFLLNIGVKNFGTGTAVGLQGVISSLDTALTVIDSVSNYNDLPHLGVEYGDGFVIYEDSLDRDNYFSITLTDNCGRVFSDQLELRSPPVPEAVNLDASFGDKEIVLYWHHGSSGDTLNNFLVFHSLTQGGPYTQVSNDLLFHTTFHDYGLLSSTRYYYIISAVDSCGNVSPYSIETSITTSPPQQAGWPNRLEKETSSSPKIGDIDGDTHYELVIGADYMYAWHDDGIEVRDGDNKPVTWGILNTEGDNFVASPTLVNLDGQPGKEIIGASWNTKEVYVFDHDGNNLSGWPKTTGNLCWASPAVADFDGDGDKEISIQDISGNVYVWHHDGTEMIDGDSNPLTDGIFLAGDGTSQGWHVSTPAFADIDQDDILELIVGDHNDSLYCLNSDGSSAAGWPVYIGNAGAVLTASPAVGDIDDDGELEVVVQNNAGGIMGVNHDGSAMSGSWPGWVKSNGYFIGSPALGDLTGDGKLEIVIPGNNGLCYIFNSSGSYLPNWPQPYDLNGGTTESSPIIADLNNDGSLDIILACEEGQVNAWDINGDYLLGFPIRLKGYVRGTPTVKDLDQDGDIELALSCWDQNIYVWDIPADAYYNYNPWDGFHGNLYNNGAYGYADVTATNEIAFNYQLNGGMVRLDWLVPNGIDSWNLYRKSEDTEYEMISSDLRADEARLIQFTDRTTQEGMVYFYKIEGKDDTVFFETNGINVPVTRARLYQNHPNPFNPSTKIAFTVPGTSESSQNTLLVIYDVRGAVVKTLINRPVAGGRHMVEWLGDNNRGGSVSSGVYFSRLRVGGFKDTKKMILLR